MSGEKGQFDDKPRTAVGSCPVNGGDGLFRHANARYVASLARYEKFVCLSVGAALVQRGSNAAGSAP